MFSRIARRYDAANTWLSFGLHHRWRAKAVRLAAPPESARALDLACGTGDFAIAFAKVIGEHGSVIATDFTSEMLVHAKEKVARYNITLEQADAMSLQYAELSFDVCSIAFGIRNVDNPVTALREMNRVVKPGGKIVVLEFGQPDGWFGKMYRWYAETIIPFLGGLITGEKSAYQYLQTTSRDFPCGEKFTSLMRQAGIENIDLYAFTGGVVYLYVGRKQD